MDTPVTVPPVRRYGLVGLLVIALGVVVFIERHPLPAGPTDSGAPATAVPAAQALLPARLTNGLRIVFGGLYSIDAVVDASGPHLIPDAPGLRVGVPMHQPIAIVGWAVDGSALRPAASIIAVLDGRIVLRAKYGGSRPDVARAFNQPAFAPSGFSVAIPARLVRAGTHTIQILILSADRSTYYQAPKAITFHAGA